MVDPKVRSQRQPRAGLRARAVLRAAPLKIAFVLVAAVVLAPAVLYKFPALAGADHAYVVLSGSMVPTFHPGDLIFVDEVDPSELRVGDVVTIKPVPTKEVLVTHRIVGIVHDEEGLAFETQGDANDDPDPTPYRGDQIVGRYEFRIPYWGLLASILKTPGGYLLFVVAPGLTILAFEFHRLYRELDAWDRARRNPATEIAFEVVGVRR